MKRLSVFLPLLINLLTVFPSEASVTPAVIKIYDEAEIEELLEQGVSIERRRGDILLCYFPDYDDADIVIGNNKKNSIIRNPGISKRFHKKPDFKNAHPYNRDKFFITPTLDEAVKFLEAYQIQQGNDLHPPFTGKGIVVGLCDIGLDPLHPVFLDEDGKSRIKKITQYDEFEGIRLELEGDDAYAEWKTDTEDNYHATHVAGILAGNGGGSSFKGIATDADVVASLCRLTDFGLLMGVEDIIDYAKEMGKPAVINLSMGNYTGAHDGSSLFSQYLDLCADDAIIVLSAGNEGNRTNTLSYSFNENSKPLEFRIGNRAWDQKSMYGITDIWNSTENPLSVTLCIFDDETHKVVYEFEPVILTDWDSVEYEWNPEEPLFDSLSLDGFLRITGGIDPENGRYEVALLYDYESFRLIGTGWAKDMISVKITGEDGDEIDVFADGSYSRLMQISGNPAPNSHLSISDLACGFRTISVGMYGNRSDFPVSVFDSDKNPFDTVYRRSGYQPFHSVVHSSYGKLRDDRTMPLTVGPGIPIISSMSRYYLDANPDAELYYIDENHIPWLATGGTSMSSPYVAGFIATWLEAVPNLTTEDIKNIIEETNCHEIPEPEDPRNLNGYFNPKEALRKLLDHNGISQIENPAYLLLPSDHIDVFNTTGILIYSGRYENFIKTQPGFYIISTPYGVMKKI